MPKPPRPRFRLRPYWLLVGATVALIAVCTALIIMGVNDAGRQMRAVQMLKEAGADVEYEMEDSVLPDEWKRPSGVAIEVDADTDAGIVLRYLPQVTATTSLALDEVEVTPELLACIARLRHLTSLQLFDARLTDETLIALKPGANLENLRLTGAAITDESIPYLCQFETLRSLDVSGTLLSIAGARELQKALPECRVYYRPRHSPAELELLNELDKRSIFAHEDFLNNELPLAADWHWHVYVSEGDGAWKCGQELAQLGNVESITLNGPPVSDAALAQLLRVHTLRVITLAEAAAITSVGLARLAELPKLERIVVVDACLSERDLRPLREARPDMQIECVRLHGERHLYERPPSMGQVPPPGPVPPGYESPDGINHEKLQALQEMFPL